MEFFKFSFLGIFCGNFLGIFCFSWKFMLHTDKTKYVIFQSKKNWMHWNKRTFLTFVIHHFHFVCMHAMYSFILFFLFDFGVFFFSIYLLATRFWRFSGLYNGHIDLNTTSNSRLPVFRMNYFFLGRRCHRRCCCRRRRFFFVDVIVTGLDRYSNYKMVLSNGV